MNVCMAVLPCRRGCHVVNITPAITSYTRKTFNSSKEFYNFGLNGTLSRLALALSMRRGTTFLHFRNLVEELEATRGKYFSPNLFGTLHGSTKHVTAPQKAFTSLASRWSSRSHLQGVFGGSTPKPSNANVSGLLLRNAVNRDARVLENALFKRFFSDEPPRRGWEKFYPKNKPRRPAAQTKAPRGENCVWVPFRFSRKVLLVL